MTDLDDRLDAEFRAIAAALVADAPAVPEASNLPTTLLDVPGWSVHRRLVGVAATAVAVLGGAGIVALGLGGDAKPNGVATSTAETSLGISSSTTVVAGATLSPTSTILTVSTVTGPMTTNSPTNGSVPLGYLPRETLTAFPLISPGIAPVGEWVGSWAFPPPYEIAAALIGAVTDDTVHERIWLYLTTEPHEPSLVDQASVPVELSDGTPATHFSSSGPLDAVTWGSGPYFTAFGTDVLGALSEVGSRVATSTVSGQLDVLAVGELPASYEVIVAPQVVPRNLVHPVLHGQSGDPSTTRQIEVSTGNLLVPYSDAIWDRPLRRVDVDGAEGWMVDDSEVYWQVDESSFAHLTWAGDPERTALDVAEALEFVADAGTYMSTYGVGLPPVPTG